MDAVAENDEEQHESRQYSTNDQEDVVANLEVVVDWVRVAGKAVSRLNRGSSHVTYGLAS